MFLGNGMNSDTNRGFGNFNIILLPLWYACWTSQYLAMLVHLFWFWKGSCVLWPACAEGPIIPRKVMRFFFSSVHNMQPYSQSRTQNRSVRQVESRGKECQLNVYNAACFSKEKRGSPVKLPKLFPNANMCYQINKATKDANGEILVAR